MNVAGMWIDGRNNSVFGHFTGNTPPSLGLITVIVWLNVLASNQRQKRYCLLLFLITLNIIIVKSVKEG